MSANKLLAKIQGGEFPWGTYDKGECTWRLHGESVTRQVNTLRKAGLVNIVYHYKFASISA